MNEDKEKMLKLTTDQIESKFGKGSIMTLGEGGADLNIGVIPTGALPLDAALGIGGVPRGRIIEIYGPESSGKTTLALQILAEAQALGGIVAFIDAEHALDPVYAARIGVDIDEVLISQPDTGEQALEICDMLVRSGATASSSTLWRRSFPVPKSRARWGIPPWAFRLGSCPRPCASWPGRCRNRTPPASSSTSCARRSASCSATRRRPPADAP